VSVFKNIGENDAVELKVLTSNHLKIERGQKKTQKEPCDEMAENEEICTVDVLFGVPFSEPKEHSRMSDSSISHSITSLATVDTGGTV